MVVPYCTSLEFQPDANPALALADVQSRLPGIRCGPVARACGFIWQPPDFHPHMLLGSGVRHVCQPSAVD